MSPRSHTLQVAGSPPIQIITTEYSNLIFAIITQVDRIGTLVSAYVENPEDGYGNYTYSIEVKFGARDSEETETLVRGILERVSKTTFKPMLVAVSITSPLDQVFTAVVEAFEPDSGREISKG